MPQMSPMDWSHLIFWFSLSTNLMKSKSRLFVNSSNNESLKTNKITISKNLMKW